MVKLRWPKRESKSRFETYTHPANSLITARILSSFSEGKEASKRSELNVIPRNSITLDAQEFSLWREEY